MCETTLDSLPTQDHSLPTKESSSFPQPPVITLPTFTPNDTAGSSSLTLTTTRTSIHAGQAKTSSTPSSPIISPKRQAPHSPGPSLSLSQRGTGTGNTPSASRANSISYSQPLSTSFTFTPAQSLSNTNTIETTTSTSTPRVLIYVRDFAFPRSDDRFRGGGVLVPRENHLARLHRRLAGLSAEDSDDETDEYGRGVDDGDGVNEAWDSLRQGWGKVGSTSINGWHTITKATTGTGPSQEEMNLNFGGESDDSSDYEHDQDDPESDLLPGLYRALYPFAPEAESEMALAEGQIVRVVGRGGEGWAVVVRDGHEGADVPDDTEDARGHALVPASYLELVRLESDEDAEADREGDASEGIETTEATEL
ncbi:hypothetical protein H0H92_001412 [Tricholoma furcatifolium]|nr:hypothetical protein H0H92_001412 [Tricholoma furcatifolium]